MWRRALKRGEVTAAGVKPHASEEAASSRNGTDDEPKITQSRKKRQRLPHVGMPRPLTNTGRGIADPRVRGTSAAGRFKKTHGPREETGRGLSPAQSQRGNPYPLTASTGQSAV